MATTTRHIGNCQVCEADQKLHDGKLVHHGYKRPGHGYIVGDCPGVNEVPYEVSCELIKTYKADVEKYLAAQEAFLAKLQAGEVTALTQVRRQSFAQDKVIELHVGVTEPYIWSRAVEHKTWEVESNIRMAKADIDRCARRIAEWKPMPIRTVEEEQVKKDADKAARATEVQKRRDEKAAKRAAITAKQEALAAKRQAIKDGFAKRLHELADKSASLAEVQSFLSELGKKKYSFIWGLRDLNCEEACIKLGLARKTETGFVQYDH